MGVEDLMPAGFVGFTTLESKRPEGILISIYVALNSGEYYSIVGFENDERSRCNPVHISRLDRMQYEGLIRSSEEAEKRGEKRHHVSIKRE